MVSFNPSFNRKAFNCKSDPLTRYLQIQASQDIKRRLAACYLAVTPEDEIAGYYTLAATSVPLPDLPDEIRAKLPRYPTIPAVLMGRLAVDDNHSGKGLGGALLFDVIQRSLTAEIAAYAMVVDAKDDEAVAFYRHFGFLSFPEKPRTLFLPLAGLKI